MFDGYLSDRPDKPPLPTLSQATEVRSEISMAADSLQVVVGWDLSFSDSAGRAGFGPGQSDPSAGTILW